MISIFLPAPVVGLLTSIAVLASVAFWGGLIMPLALIKFLVPLPPVQNACRQISVWIAFNWASTIQLISRVLHTPNWQVDWRGKLDPDKSYLLVSNHQSWADILILFDLFHARVPFL